MEFDNGDLVYVRPALDHSFALGIVIDVDPAEEAPTYYLIYISGREPDWYIDNEVFSAKEAINAT